MDSSHPRSASLPWLFRGLQAVASLKLAVVLIAVYAVVLACGTLVESRYGAAVAHENIYDSLWFASLNGLLGLNVLAALAIRFPWKRRQMGFVITHLGILVLLVGCLVSRQYGVEAQLSVFEGHAASRAVTANSDELELGFQVFLHQFQRKLDPGTGAPSHYASLVDFLDRDDPPHKLQENVLITLNAPVDFADPKSGRTYRLFQSSFSGPWTPGEPEFDQLVGNDRSRDRVYRSHLSVNDDPGRGLKYLGSLLVVAGIILVYYLRASLVRNRHEEAGETDTNASTNIAGRAVGSVFFLALLLSLPDIAQGDALNWDAWRRLPVFGEGRVVPLDTFARETVETICGQTDPTLTLSGEPSRRFSSAELLFSWLTEPERWESVPFLAAQDPQLRRDVLGLPLVDDDGRPLRYVSPEETENSAGLGRAWADMQRRAETEGKTFRPAGVEKRIQALVDAYGAFRQLARDPNAPQDSPRRFIARFRAATAAWRTLATSPEVRRRLAGDSESHRPLVESGELLQELMASVHGDDFSVEKVEPLVAKLSKAAQQVASRLDDPTDKPLTAMAADFGRQAVEMHRALYDNGGALRCVPALSSAALEENRTPEDDASPWLSFQSMMFGSDQSLCGYPPKEIKTVRDAWADVKRAYLDRAAADRAEQFNAAMDRFAAAVRTLGEAVEPLRQTLPILHRDQTLIDTTAYPPSNSTDVEIFYNRLDPFFWSWVVSLAATLCLLLAVGRWQRSLFWLGIGLLVGAQLFTVAGFGLRMDLTGLVPLTGMFETVVFVALCVAALGLWFALLPLVWRGLRTAWRLSAFRNRDTDRRGTAAFLLLLLRAALMVAVFLALVRIPNWPGHGIFDLTPPIALGAASPSANDLLVWISGLCVLLAAAYYVPRAAVALAVSLLTIPHAMLRHGTEAAMTHVLERRLFALSGAIISFLATVLAYYAPATVMHRDIGSAAPILRDNFWLVVHVVTIIAAYGSAAIALILGNIALGYYFLGHYTDCEESGRRRRRPPEACAVLAGFIDTALQITVLLLAAGTILGALWADKAWGRFWAWDPKEVWALVSLLVYAAFLHARAAGWSRDFGTALAAVLGATAVLFTWYGVNFLLGSGMHAYGEGAGGQWQVATAVAVEWLFLAAAGARYGAECGMMNGE